MMGVHCYWRCRPHWAPRDGCALLLAMPTSHSFFHDDDCGYDAAYCLAERPCRLRVARCCWAPHVAMGPMVAASVLLARAALAHGILHEPFRVACVAWYIVVRGCCALTVGIASARGVSTHS